MCSAPLTPTLTLTLPLTLALAQVRSALLSGAERERCYMLRANAYLHVG